MLLLAFIDSASGCRRFNFNSLCVLPVLFGFRKPPGHLHGIQQGNKHEISRRAA
jgi:hypothetical protein